MALLQGVLVFVLMIGAIAAAVAVRDHVASAIEQSRQLVMRATTRAETVRHVVEALKDVEIGEHGYLLTGMPVYLAPYWSGLTKLDAALDRLDELAVGMPMLRAQADTLADLARAKVATAAHIIRVARERGHDVAAAELQATGDHTRMSRARERADEMLRRIGVDHEARLAEVRANEALASATGVATAAICAVLLGIAVLVLLRGRARLQNAQGELGTQSVRLAGTIDHMRDGIAVFASDGGLLLWNDQFADQVAPTQGALRAGTSIERLASSAWPNDPPPTPLPGLPTLREVQVGSRSYEIWRGRMPDDGQILVVAETTRRNRAETIARQAQKMEALGQLTGGVAHDFNNLLQVISTNLELIGAPSLGSAAIAERRAAALSAVGRASQLTRHLLAFARRQPLTPKAIDTAELLGGLEDMLRRTLGEAMVIDVVFEPGLWPIRADPQQLENAILNLAINGRDAMDGQGTLTLTASNVTRGDEDISHLIEVTAGDYVAIAVTDTGIGMSEEQLGRAIEPFYTTKPEGRGTGLGLAMVFGFAKQSHGHLQLTSALGQGTTARLCLPRSRATPQSQPEPDCEPAAADGELVLVVEDDVTVRTASCQALQQLGYRTLQAENAAAALDQLRGGLRPDLLFTDIVMPGEPDAPAMVRQARQIVPGLAVVYSSGYADVSVMRDGRLDPGITLVSKPWRATDLARTLRQALDAVRTAPSRGLRIVLAEDDALVRMTTDELLSDLGHDVVEAATAAEALEAVQTQPPQTPVDLLITDVGLPDMDGLMLAARVGQLRPDLPVVVASGREPDPGNRHRWLEKPYNLGALREAIERAVTHAQDRTSA